jgi:alpha-beta hydrolase superfamily lysophospholipase
MSDGYVLPMKTWSAIGEPAAVIFALHGFNDYSNAFDASAHYFADVQITTYAIDQRGFGTTQQRGVWAGTDTMQSDLIATINLLCERHTALPVFVLGESMGATVILSALQQLESTCIQGVILMAPAVWGWQVMPWWQTVPLRMLAHTMPETTLTGEGLEIQASDNEEMLRALGRDPLIIREVRVDTIYGLTDLMEAGLVNSKALRMPALILYGANDEIIPAESFCEMLNNLPDSASPSWRLIYYPNGYHMLSRDLQGEVVILDMVTWIRDQSALFPSGQEAVSVAGQGKSNLMLPNVCED